MSSSICNDHTGWHVSNMMFARVLQFGIEVGSESAKSQRERDWVRDLAAMVTSLETYNPDLSVSELFSDAEQLGFWCSVLSELALRIYRREIGDQSDQSWQVSTIWAAVDLARVLDSSAQQMQRGGVG